MVPSDNHFSAAVKLSMLQNAVSGVPELHAVKVQASYDKARGLIALGYEQYCNLLLATASSYDLKNGSLNKNRDRRNVNIHEIDEFNHGEYEQSDIDTDVSTLMINAHDQRARFNTRVDSGIWIKMSPEEREQWGGLSNETKASILGAQPAARLPRKFDQQRPPNKFPPRRFNDSKTRSINLHDISAYNYLHDNTQDIAIDDDQGQDKDEDVHVDATSSGASEDANPLLAFVTKRTPTATSTTSLGTCYPPRRNGMKLPTAKLL
jgi:hypothetical protein